MESKIPDQLHFVYFIGIGGIGMSALAQYFAHRGVLVKGYDADRSAVIDRLTQEGIVVHHSEEESIQDMMPDLVVYTPAVPATHKGMQYYLSSGVPLVKRSRVLGWISERHRCIAVAGTHGKTTTSAMLTYALRRSGQDVTAFLGGIVPDLKGNYVQGTSEWLVAEADEYDRSFHALTPEIAVVTAMDADHLDIYGDYAEMINGYVGFLRNVRPAGTVVLSTGVKQKLPEGILKEFVDKGINVVTFGTEDAEYCISKISRLDRGSEFTVLSPEAETRVTLQMPGLHNALNATVALAVGDVLGIHPSAIAEALHTFTGIKRRFEILYSDERHTVIDDYAHHPEELRAAISAARLQYPEKKITGVFQPHLYTRTRDFYQEFADALQVLDTCILVELYPARELPIDGVSSKLIFDQIENANKYLTSKKELLPLLKDLNPEVLLLLGAGDLDRMTEAITETLNII